MNVACLEYFTHSDGLTSELRETAERNLQNGVQYLIADKRQNDGSFTSGRGVLWMSAYIARLMNQAKIHISINDRYIYNALQFIREKQQPDGSFLVERVSSSHPAARFKTQISITAFIAISFLEKNDYATSFKPIIDTALSYVSDEPSRMTNNFDLAISCYAISLNEVGISWKIW